ncbi:glutathione synthase [Synechococcus sp. CS-1325]|uniref:glutathione synthase n=1 Tax=unclassified Synechococcus TaxID=2626047 RepID=UPI000DB77393|nr:MULTISPECIES: glutathione synthase [unclassified Synechococcus]MCT0199806.1 glutathione synthase [Synechococcus sp. CS-1325]MCT0231357.1 glutathione synthase [Synechococcus sp. CS-1324]PZU99220.1 MAG: glutathione synthase [Cyanobium sp.]PZV02666.1 MAG: glutathione synthase [Cyanobium sp.]
MAVGSAGVREPQLFIVDPISRLRPSKDSSVALMQAAQRAGQQVWACTPADLAAAGAEALVRAQPISLAAIQPTADGWQVPDPWLELGEATVLPLHHFPRVWMRKDPPVDEAYLYATHLLELAERRGVRVLNRPAALRAWNEKLGSLRFSHLMAPTLVASSVEQLAAFTARHGAVVLKPLGGRAGQGVVRTDAAAPGLAALLELVTQQQQMPVMVQAFLPAVREGDKRILLVNGEPIGAINRRPAAGEFRSNLAVGGEPERTELSDQERRICSELAPALQEAGLFFVGIDVIDGRLSEINVTSPTGVREIERLGGIPLADLTMERLLKD